MRQTYYNVTILSKDKNGLDSPVYPREIKKFPFNVLEYNDESDVDIQLKFQDGSLIVSDMKGILTAYAPGEWFKVERVEEEDIDF